MKKLIVFDLDGTLAESKSAVRGRDGELYLFPRLVARGNYSSIAECVSMRTATRPASSGWALHWSRKRITSGGCEDPRIAFVEPFHRYVMTYTALSPQGPRIALALSEDLFRWQRLGLASFRPHNGIEFDGVDNQGLAGR